MKKIKFKKFNYFNVILKLLFYKILKKKNKNNSWINFKDFNVEYFDFNQSKIKVKNDNKTKIDIQSDYYPMN
tara:strand:+ start:8578 stop:8793 length:216 start_codon:yes stop_codon:yes gene_type:complete